MIKKYRGRRLAEVVRRAVWGAAGRIKRLLRRTWAGGQINTSYIERLNATFRSRLAGLAQRTRGLARGEETLRSGMFLVGATYNQCREHRSLRLWDEWGQRHERTPAIAAGWTDHPWSGRELLGFKVRPALHG